MADKKISALTSASTPLAGTEVLPIVQSGSTVKVAVSDLTAGRTQTSNGIVQGTAATGYNFTANTPAAGMTSQLLNWYEEGTFTPGIAFGGGTTGIAYATNNGRYTRIGRQVTCIGIVSLTSKGSSAGDAALTGLPFTVNADTGSAGAILFSVISGVTFSIAMTGRATAAATTVDLLQTSALGAVTTITNTNFANNSQLNFVVTYFI